MTILAAFRLDDGDEADDGLVNQRKTRKPMTATAMICPIFTDACSFISPLIVGETGWSATWLYCTGSTPPRWNDFVAICGRFQTLQEGEKVTVLGLK